KQIGLDAHEPYSQLAASACAGDAGADKMRLIRGRMLPRTLALGSRKTMAELDAASVAQLAIKSGLITPAQLQEAYEEIGEKTTDLNKLLNTLERKRYLTPFQSSKLIKGDTDGYILAGYR